MYKEADRLLSALEHDHVLGRTIMSCVKRVVQSDLSLVEKNRLFSVLNDFSNKYRKLRKGQHRAVIKRLKFILKKTDSVQLKKRWSYIRAFF